jgi:D-beta-D-heptose 7-phosphate kinase/D-beta-D-heptose 1-phosphate adenosyltransferase
LNASAREVADVTGAGDTVIALLALSMAAGARLADAARVANAAAGLVVARFGPAVVDPTELTAALADIAG